MAVDPNRVYIPEVLEPDALLPRDLLALRKLATLLDAAVSIPGTRRKIGLDAGLGLIPGVGDAIGAALSAWILVGAIRHRVPAGKIARMAVNVLIDLGVGSIPIIGDIFDFFFQENVLNLQLLMQHRDRAQRPRSGVQMAFWAFAVILLMSVVAFFALAGVIAAIVWVTGQRT